MKAVKGQCFDCYGDSVFQYFGQTGDYDSLEVQLDYVAKLKIPMTVVDCVTCGRTMEYREQEGKWKSTVQPREDSIDASQ